MHHLHARCDQRPPIVKVGVHAYLSICSPEERTSRILLESAEQHLKVAKTTELEAEWPGFLDDTETMLRLAWAELDKKTTTKDQEEVGNAEALAKLSLA